MFGGLTNWARRIKRDVVALYLAARDQATPWPAKALAALVAAYALSPIDLIPDFIPVIGYLDDILLVPLGVWCAVRLVPANVMEVCRLRSEALLQRPVSRSAARWIVAIWSATGLFTAWFVYISVQPA